MKNLLAAALLSLTFASAASANQADIEYAQVKAAAARVLGTTANNIRTNTILAGKSEYSFVFYTAQSYQQLGYKAFNSKKVFSLVQTWCAGDAISASITASCLTDAILASR